MNIKKTVLVIAVLAAAVAFFALDLGRFLSLDYLKQSQAQFAALVQSQPLLVAGSYFWSMWRPPRCRCRVRPSSRWPAAPSLAWAGGC
jgi:hypothetical protein